MDLQKIQEAKALFAEPFTHLGIVVRDMDAYVQLIGDTFGYEVGAYGVTPNTPDRCYHGEYEDFAVKMAFIYVKDTMVELLMPLRGRNIWQEHLDKHGEGLHHINFNVREYDSAIAHLQSLGMKMVMNGMSSRFPDSRWCYFDALDTLGFCIELFELKD